jgi:S-adenosylmethionine:tRNA ribosyltransferase-isomerase
MIHPKFLSIIDYLYALPDDRIAYQPLPQRDRSKLLVYKKGMIVDDVFENIITHLPAGNLLVMNDTRVVEARLLFQKSSGGIIEIFCLEPHPQYGGIANALATTGEVRWLCLVGGASKWKKGQVLEKKIAHPQGDIILQASFIEKTSEAFTILLSWDKKELNFAEILHLAGAVPLPPYIKRNATANDIERYQTVYADVDGSVAAPTAGLHFTEKIFSSLEEKNISRAFVTLHVGAGTFKPVKAAQMQDHLMHAEYIDVSQTTIRTILAQLSKGIIAVGTTSLRTIESLYWMGVKVLQDHNDLSIFQWDAYELDTENIPASLALESLLQRMKEEKAERLISKTQLLIAPGYQPRIADALVTNFHQPGSTLLLLVAALIGEDWKKMYAHALENDYRFLSYGDSSLLLFD